MSNRIIKASQVKTTARGAPVRLEQLTTCTMTARDSVIGVERPNIVWSPAALAHYSGREIRAISDGLAEPIERSNWIYNRR